MMPVFLAEDDNQWTQLHAIHLNSIASTAFNKGKNMCIWHTTF